MAIIVVKTKEFHDDHSPTPDPQSVIALKMQLWDHLIQVILYEEKSKFPLFQVILYEEKSKFPTNSPVLGFLS